MKKRLKPILLCISVTHTHSIYNMFIIIFTIKSNVFKPFMFCTYICIIIIIILILCVIIIKAFTINWAKNGCSENGKQERKSHTLSNVCIIIFGYLLPI